MQTLAIIRIAALLVAGGLFFVFSRRLSSLPLRGYALWVAGFGLVLLNLAIGALFHSEMLPHDWQSRWMPVIGSISGYGGLTLGLILFLIGTYRLVGSLQSYLDTRYYNLVEHSLVGIYLLQDNVFKFINSRAAEITGYSRDELVGKPFIEFVAPQSRALVMENIRKRIAGEVDEVHYEFTCLKKNGEPLEIEVHGSRTLYDGRPAIQGTLVDITARKRAEEALKARERQQAAVATLGQRALAGVDLDTLMNEVVAAVAETLDVQFCKVLELLPQKGRLLLRAGVGWKPGEVGNATVGTGMDSQSGFTLHNDRPVIVEDLRTETRFSGPALLLDHGVVSGISVIVQGQPRPFGVLGAHTTKKRAFTDDDVYFMQAVANVLAVAMARQQTEQALRETEERYRTLVERLPDGIYRSTAEGKFLDINPAMVKIYGYDSKEELMAIDIRKQLYFDPKDREAIIENIRQAGNSHIGICRQRRKNGEEVWTEYNSTLGYDETGKLLYHEGMVRNITERIKAEEKLRESEARFRNLADTAPVLIWMSDSDKLYTYFNKRWLEFTGRTLEQECASGWVEDLHPDDAQRCIDTYTTAFNARQPFKMDYRLRRQDGEYRWVQDEGVPRFTPGGDFAGYIGSCIDLTERKQAEQAMLQAQKLESLGVLAGGIAHDFNNLLVGILGNAGLALMELPPESPARETVKQIETAGQHAAELARLMLAYSGKGHFVIQPLNLNLLIEETEHLLHVAIAKNVVLKYNFAHDLPAIEADATQIRQVVMNLVLNASEAIGDANGIITITTGAMHVDRDYLAETYLMPDLKTGEYVHLEIADTGCGMDAETQAKIFDPFFTTKFTGRGLGLAAVLGIVRGHKGAIKISSTPEQGTAFKVLLPCAEVNSAPAPSSLRHLMKTMDQGEARSRQMEKIQSGTIERGVMPSLPGLNSRVLVIDDDASVRKVTARVLKQLGFNVLAAAGGKEGLEIFDRHAHEISCVLLDLTMPHPTGEEVFREIQRLKQNTPVILMSGYSEKEATSFFAGKGLAGFLKKPYTSTELREQLEKVYNRSQS